MRTFQCVICNKEFKSKYFKKTCSSECKIKQIHNLWRDHKESILHKRRITTSILHTKEEISVRSRSKTINFYDNLAERLAQITILYTKSEVHKLLNSEQFNYKKYFGRGKNRALIRDDIKLYKSLYEYTNFIDTDNLHVISPAPFRLRLIIAGEFNFNIPQSCWCSCGRQINFDHQGSKEFTKLYCSKCLPSRNSKEHFKCKYGDSWEKFYIKNCEKYKECGYRLGVARVADNMRRFGKIICPNVGKNEQEILDKIEREDGITIMRGHHFTLPRGGILWPDGYCEETNTIYEIYEPWHKYYAKKDKLRINILKEEYNCNVVVIKDGW